MIHLQVATETIKETNNKLRSAAHRASDFSGVSGIVSVSVSGGVSGDLSDEVSVSVPDEISVEFSVSRKVSISDENNAVG